MSQARQQDRRPPVPAGSSTDLDDAFREVHGPTLHGFALLLVLGDAALAARLASGALLAAAGHADELRHPERAAAWLRGRVLSAAPRRDTPIPAQRRLAGLEPLHVGGAVLAGLAGLDRLQRAAIIAASIEHLERNDVAAIVGREGPALDTLLRRARRRYLEGASRAVGRRGDTESGPGPTRRLIADAAARAMA